MNCPNCQTSVLGSDRFCEACGTPLVAHTPLGEMPLTAIPSMLPEGCPKCGASQDAFDPEGYCSQCGFRHLSQPKRLEITLSAQLAAASDPGLRHSQNEDFVAIQTINHAHIDPLSLTDTHILVVCDGVSSSETPELAAQTVAHAVCAELATAIATLSPEAAMQQAIAAGLAAVCTIPHTRDSTDPPSTTLVAALVQNQTATIAWLGDSRAYWLSAQDCQQLTQDDSWINDVVSKGEMTLTEAQRTPHAHAITRWLGADAQTDATPTLLTITLKAPGYLLLCTDGLWNYTPHPSHLWQLIQPKTSLDAIAIAHHLIEFARSRGGHDNITVSLLAL